MELDIIYSNPYEEHAVLCNRVKDNRKLAGRVGEILSCYVPNKAVLIPVPSHEGFPTYTYEMAVGAAFKAGAVGKDVHIFSAVGCTPRSSICELKREGRELPKELFFEIDYTDRLILEGLIKQGYTPVVIDNVIDTGRTALAMQKIVGVPCKFICIGCTENYKER